jgi:hypothetical protein
MLTMFLEGCRAIRILYHPDDVAGARFALRVSTIKVTKKEALI